ncbi:hypothetical protein [Mesorhizobium sp. B263B2A]|uniref:hypothetical protein n=1 Tax=Mesorhizobium sp. B263B2A TaxID=2876669 RepID=UPI001CD05BC6|nr:hypothetical protein [Mesorhizobium sp. B263B2A]MCA0032732.1 hypothetical protein [Mesorhizobium sp. B263B2A]
MRVFAYRATAAGIARRASERGQPIAAIEAVEAERAPTVTPKASNVIRFRRPPVAHETRRMSSAQDFRRAKHMAFLAGLDISTQTPVKALIDRVAAWHGFSHDDIIKDCRQRKLYEARLDCVVAVKQAYPEATQPWLGKRFHRDSTTMFYALRKRGLA